MTPNPAVPPPTLPLPSDSGRIVPLDVMRGIVIVLMALDHASYHFNAGRYVTDSVVMYTAGSAIPALQFIVRWITHICAPTFVFLAGWALYLHTGKQTRAGASASTVDRFILVRGVMILALDPLWMSIGFGGGVVFQVLYAIGAGLCCMAALRRLGLRTLLAAAGVLLIAGEALAGLALWAGGGESAGPIVAFLITGGRVGPSVFVVYPLLPWLAYMLLGWCCGRWLAEGRVADPVRFFLLAGLICLAVFGAVRGLNAYGNMLLYREGASILQWLHVSKYPPSLSFSTLELGLMALCLALLFRIHTGKTGSPGNPLQVFGQTPLFFYVLHVHLLAVGARVLSLQHRAGLTVTVAAAAGVLLLLYPLCRWYRRAKRLRRFAVLRFL
jgi:uncharacterized membrane protein